MNVRLLSNLTIDTHIYVLLFYLLTNWLIRCKNLIIITIIKLHIYKLYSGTQYAASCYFFLKTFEYFRFNSLNIKIAVLWHYYYRLDEDIALTRKIFHWHHSEAQKSVPSHYLNVKVPHYHVRKVVMQVYNLWNVNFIK